ncbi:MULTISPECIES: DUF2599 domain-containing protein [unclassified Isoptericola]|uniref:DUF2599 domain-containing protein n=1 Tax=unclassified Isoptericola TaxID=2623355 RepID=UPI00365F8D6B
MHPRPSRAALTLALLLPLAACTPAAPAPADATATSATASRTPTPAHEVRVEVAAGDVTLEVTVPGASDDDPRVTVERDDDASTAAVTFAAAALGDDDAGPPRIALTSGGTLASRPDGSVVVRDGGTAVGGLSAPRGARLVAVDDTHLEVRATAASDAEVAEDAEDAAGATTVLGTAGVRSADWGDREGGRSLAVDATAWARDAGQAGVDLVWAELVADDPEVDTSTMHDQLECHAIGAPDKATWNLEPWRPDVGLVATMAARCNPTS